ncbi:uncharacterized protein LOC119908713 isoform X3 [Micropterus salmoides]|uniref:uncharacterized protein LOC119908713 isoform X3 n=1 Tax=Micropterus salmoides TaxID=27706 RepID=UPI0018EBCE85|nr:uncharacterized protein LOC119908713 isoform X3 [Micropterus salmoides]
MVRFRWIKTSLFVILVLQFTAATGQNLSFTVRVGDEVILHCGNVIQNQDNCDGTSWLVSRDIGAAATELIIHGKISKNGISEAKSDRLNVTAECFLVIKNVTVEDNGRYTCRQFNKSGQQHGPDSLVVLSVINMEQYQNNDTVGFICSVLTYGKCEHTVKWLYEGNKNHTVTQGSCSASVVFTAPPLSQKSNYCELLKCNVTDNKSGQMLLCSVDLQSLCEKTGSTLRGKNKTPSGKGETTTKPDMWQFIVVAVGLAALLIIIVVVIRWKKAKGNKTKMDENIRLSLNPAVTQPGPETMQDMTDPEDGVSYASISYTRKTNSKVQDDHDEDDAVTYSSVKASSPSAGGSADPSDLYATVNKPNKKEDVV